mmetsp:Transcript_18623/g.46494  ORF Transcript_18623/g.46494 Transcript_18623/m.46494 type:complete len:86 (-) Transcript_18623:81-338(-)
MQLMSVRAVEGYLVVEEQVGCLRTVRGPWKIKWPKSCLLFSVNKPSSRNSGEILHDDINYSKWQRHQHDAPAAPVLPSVVPPGPP